MIAGSSGPFFPCGGSETDAFPSPLIDSPKWLETTSLDKLFAPLVSVHPETSDAHDEVFIWETSYQKSGVSGLLVTIHYSLSKKLELSLSSDRS